MRAHPRAGAAEPLRNWQEAVLSRVIRLSGYSAIVFVGLIFLFLVREGLPALVEVPLADLFSARWYPIEGYFGVLPLITGSLIVTVGAGGGASPLGIGTAMFISETAPRWAGEVLKPMVELLGGLPSVVLGFLGMLVLSPFLRQALDLPPGLPALAGSLLLAGIALPTIVSIAEDALDAVPKSYRQGGLALGATRGQTMGGGRLPA